MGSPPMSPAGQIETRNSVYFELRKFPLVQDKGSAYRRTEESSGKRGRSFRSGKDGRIRRRHMISIGKCVQVADPGHATTSGKRKERATAANSLPRPVPAHQNPLFVSTSERN